MNKKIEDSVVVITGASSGIGRATALRIAKSKGTVILSSRQHDAIEELGRECESLGGRALVIAGDVTDEGAVKHVAKRAIETFGKIDVWINNAACTIFGRFEDIPAESFHRVIQTNLFGYVNGARASIPHFRERGSGLLINISSVMGLSSSPYLSAYNTSKAAINALSRSLRMELSDAPNIEVCTILPASIDTPLFQHGANYTGKAVKPLDPVYSAEQVVDAIVSCIKHPRAEIVVGRAGQALGMMERLAPRKATEEAVRKLVEENHFQEKPADISTGNLFEPRSSFNQISGGWMQSRSTAEVPGATAPRLVLLATVIGVATLFYRQRQEKQEEKQQEKPRKKPQKRWSWATPKQRRGFHIIGG